MRPRLALGKFLIRLGRLISSLAVMVMRPDDLVESSRRTYAKPEKIEYWGSDKLIASGLTDLEEMCLQKTNLNQGKVLVLGLGGGRDAIPLAQMGFEVTGVDFVPELVEIAQVNAAKHGVQLEGQVGEFSQLAVAPGVFDLAWLADRMYSSMPTRNRRVTMLRKVNEALKPGGWFLCIFFWHTSQIFSPRVERLRKVFAYLTRGNLEYEAGDLFLGEFNHVFQDEGELSLEFAEGGFDLVHLHIPDEGDTFGAALLQKPI